MNSYLDNLLIIIFEVFCCNVFYESFGRKRYKDKKCLNCIQLLFLCLCGFCFAELLANHFIVRQLINIIVISGVMYWHTNISYNKSFVLAILYDGLMLMSDFIAFSVNSRFFSSNHEIMEYHGLEGYLVTLLGKVILFLCILIIRKKFSHKDTDMLKDTEWLRFLFFPVFTIIIISSLLSSFNYVETKRQANVLFVHAVGTAGMNMVVFYLINDIVDREIKINDNRINQMQVKNQVNMYRSISEKFESQKRKTHEFKNQIMCIESLLAKKQYDELKKYVKNINGDLNKELDLINTNHVIINAVLNTKYQEMTEKKIVFVFRVNNLAEVGIRDEDIVIILSNLLNNAIETCNKCSGKRIIRLKFIKESDHIIIAVKNTFNHIIHYKDGEIKSTKISEEGEHGVGIINIVRTIEKYGGSYVIQELEREFLFSIVIPLGQKRGIL